MAVQNGSSAGAICQVYYKYVAVVGMVCVRQQSVSVQETISSLLEAEIATEVIEYVVRVVIVVLALLVVVAVIVVAVEEDEVVDY